MLLKNIILILFTLTFAEELLASPLKFPEETDMGQARGASSAENVEARFHHHRKKKKKRPGCGPHRFKRADSQGRFFFPILNYYDTNVYINNGGGHNDGTDSGCGSGGGSVLPGLGGGLGNIGSGLGGGVGSLGSGLGGGVGNLGSGLGGGVGSLGSGLGGGVGNLGSGLGGGLGTLGSGITSNLPSIGSGIPGLGGSRPPSSPQSTRPPPILPPLASRPPAQVTTLDPDNEDYDYTDFSTTTRTRPVNSLADYPVINSISNSIRPVFERPQRVFNQYVVRPINRTIREFYSLF